MANGASGSAFYDVSQTGSLVYVAKPASSDATLEWVDRQGQETPIPAPPRDYAFPRLSPDGTRLAIYIPNQEIDIWMCNMARATLARATFDPGVDVPVRLCVCVCV